MLLLLPVAGSVLIEALSRLDSPPVVDDERLLPVAIAGLLVNMVGLVCFHQHHAGDSKCYGHDQCGAHETL